VCDDAARLHEFRIGARWRRDCRALAGEHLRDDRGLVSRIQSAAQRIRELWSPESDRRTSRRARNGRRPIVPSCRREGEEEGRAPIRRGFGAPIARTNRGGRRGADWIFSINMPHRFSDTSRFRLRSRGRSYLCLQPETIGRRNDLGTGDCRRDRRRFGKRGDQPVCRCILEHCSKQATSYCETAFGLLPFAVKPEPA
jgi:hypothetical protein